MRGNERMLRGSLISSVSQDILPLRKGHTLVIPKAHYSRVSELPPEYAAAAGVAISHVANALTKGQKRVVMCA